MTLNLVLMFILQYPSNDIISYLFIIGCVGRSLVHRKFTYSRGKDMNGRMLALFLGKSPTETYIIKGIYNK